MKNKYKGLSSAKSSDYEKGMVIILLNTIQWSILFLLLIGISIYVIIYLLQREKASKKQLEAIELLIDEIAMGKTIASTYTEEKDSIISLKLRELLLKIAWNEKKHVTEKEVIHSIISDITHQITTPVTNILLYTELMKEVDRVPDDLLSYIDELSIQGEKIDFLVTALTKLSHLEKDIVKFNFDYYKVTDMIKEAYKQLIRKALQRNITFILEESSEISYVDYKWTLEAFFNILDNAIKYSNYHGSIRVNVIPNDTFVHIRFKDTGIGIEKSELSYIFQRFYRGKNTSNKEGVGIGLYFVREIVSAQGGYVFVESDIGESTTFHVYLRKKG